MFATFERLTAADRSAPDVSTAASRDAKASNRFAAGRNDRPVSRLRTAATRSANSGCVLMPVPTAVPPIASSESESRQPESRRAAFPTCVA